MVTTIPGSSVVASGTCPGGYTRPALAGFGARHPGRLVHLDAKPVAGAVAERLPVPVRRQRVPRRRVNGGGRHTRADGGDGSRLGAPDGVVDPHRLG